MLKWAEYGIMPSYRLLLSQSQHLSRSACAEVKTRSCVVMRFPRSDNALQRKRRIANESLICWPTVQLQSCSIELNTRGVFLALLLPLV